MAALPFLRGYLTLTSSNNSTDLLQPAPPSLERQGGGCQRQSRALGTLASPFNTAVQRTLAGATTAVYDQRCSSRSSTLRPYPPTILTLL